jgi:aldose 1-epimerase
VATVAEVGGGLCSYTVNGVPLVDGYGEDEPCPAGAGQQLVPWPNRIRDGKYQFAGVEEQLAITEPARSNAIHGLLCWTSWQAVDQSPSAVTMIGIIRSQPGYPHTVEVRTCYSISETGLEISVEASNIGIDDCPFGYGAHPYLMVAGVAVDDLRLCLPATERVVFDRRCLPIGRQQVSCTPMDYGLPRKLSQTELDDAFYRRSSRSALLSTEDGRGVELWADEAFPWFQVFTGDTLDPPRRRRAVAIEPMSCPPDAFNSGVDLVVLSPGEVWRGRWGIRPLF